MKDTGLCLLMIPYIDAREAMTIGEFRFVPSDQTEQLRGPEGDVVLAAQRALSGKPGTGIRPYLFSVRRCDDPEGMRRAALRSMSILRYLAFRKGASAGRTLDFFFWSPIYLVDQKANMKYSMNGWKNGFSYQHLWAPGNSLEPLPNLALANLQLPERSDLVDAFNGGALNDLRLRAIERFNAARTAGVHGDPVSEIINLTIALESLYKAETGDSKNFERGTFKVWLSERFNDLVGQWAKRFYETRSNFAHSGIADFPTDSPEESLAKEFFFEYTPPGASAETALRHAYIAAEVVEALLEIGPAGEIMRDAAKRRLTKTLTPNELLITKINELRAKNISWESDEIRAQTENLSNHNDSSRITNKGLEMLKDLLAYVGSSQPDLLAECEEIAALMNGDEPSDSAPSISVLAAKIRPPHLGNILTCAGYSWNWPAGRAAE